MVPGDWDRWCQVNLMVSAVSVFRDLGNIEKGSVGEHLKLRHAYL